MTVDRRDGDDDPLGRVPVRPASGAVLVAADELARRLGHRAPGFELAGRAPLDPLEVIAQQRHLVEAGDGAVARHDDRRGELDDPLEGADPVRGRACPHHRGDADEQDVGREHDRRVGEVDDRVAGSMRRADLEQPQLAPAHGDGELAAPLPRRRRDPDLGEVVRREHPLHVGAELAEREAGHAGRAEAPEHRERQPAQAAKLWRQPLQAHQRRGRFLADDRGGGARGDDLRPVEQLVAPHVVAIGVSVDERLDRRVTRWLGHRREHPPSQP